MPKKPFNYGQYLIYPLGHQGQIIGSAQRAENLHSAQQQGAAMQQRGICVHYAVLRVVATSQA